MMSGGGGFEQRLLLNEQLLMITARTADRAASECEVLRARVEALESAERASRGEREALLRRLCALADFVEGGHDGGAQINDTVDKERERTGKKQPQQQEETKKATPDDDVPARKDTGPGPDVVTSPQQPQQTTPPTSATSRPRQQDGHCAAKNSRLRTVA